MFHDDEINSCFPSFLCYCFVVMIFRLAVPALYVFLCVESCYKKAKQKVTEIVICQETEKRSNLPTWFSSFCLNVKKKNRILKETWGGGVESLNPRLLKKLLVIIVQTNKTTMYRTIFGFTVSKWYVILKETKCSLLHCLSLYFIDIFAAWPWIESSWKPKYYLVALLRISISLAYYI